MTSFTLFSSWKKTFFISPNLFPPSIYIIKGNSGPKKETPGIYKVLIDTTPKYMVLFFHYHMDLNVNVCQGTTVWYSYPQICRSLILTFSRRDSDATHCRCLLIPGGCWCQPLFLHWFLENKLGENYGSGSWYTIITSTSHFQFGEKTWTG